MDTTGHCHGGSALKWLHSAKKPVEKYTLTFGFDWGDRLCLQDKWTTLL